jgi:hypothetical protein
MALPHDVESAQGLAAELGQQEAGGVRGAGPAVERVEADGFLVLGVAPEAHQRERRARAHAPEADAALDLDAVDAPRIGRRHEEQRGAEHVTEMAEQERHGLERRLLRDLLALGERHLGGLGDLCVDRGAAAGQGIEQQLEASGGRLQVADRGGIRVAHRQLGEDVESAR